MGTYATTTSMENVMIGTQFDTATINLASKCIEWAEEEVNKHVASRYDISSFTYGNPPLVQSLTEQLAVGFMRQEMSRGGKESLARGQSLIDRVMKNLEKVRDGKVKLTDSSGNVLNTRSTRPGVKSNTSDYTPTFAEDNSLKWKVDEDKLDDIESDRA